MLVPLIATIGAVLSALKSGCSLNGPKEIQSHSNTFSVLLPRKRHLNDSYS
jgi:hypothetical protein